MNKKLLRFFSIPAAVALLWLLAFGIQEFSNASLRDENYIQAKPLSQGLYRLRPVAEKDIAHTPNIFITTKGRRNMIFPRPFFMYQLQKLAFDSGGKLFNGLFLGNLPGIAVRHGLHILVGQPVEI